MTEFLQLPEDTRRQLIGQVSTKSGINDKALEKDWWVTLTLRALFSLPMAEHFIFKGGTSLSKGWKLIERFSEDIDIALAPEAFGKTYEVNPTHSYVKKLKKEGCAYTSTVIREALEQQFIQMGVPAGLLKIEPDPVPETFPDKDPQTLYVHFPSLYEENAYLIPPVKLEFGVRALPQPVSTIEVQSLFAEFNESAVYTETKFNVTAVEPRKTFIEKLILLHEKFLTGRAEGEAGERQSRHLSDLLQMRRRNIHEEVIADTGLYQSLIHHRRHYVRLKEVDYDALALRQLKFLPPYDLLASFRKDYETMRTEMIYGDAPDFAGLLIELRALNQQLAGLGHTRIIADVIQDARGKILPEHAAADAVSIAVVYTIDQQRTESPINIISFLVDFLKSGDGFEFHQVTVI